MTQISEYFRNIFFPNLGITLKNIGDHISIGSFEIRFYENNVVSVSSNGNETEGTYELLEDDYVVHMVFDNAEFYGIMTQSGDDVIYVISNVTSPDIALYLTYFEEG